MRSWITVHPKYIYWYPLYFCASCSEGQAVRIDKLFGKTSFSERQAFRKDKLFGKTSCSERGRVLPLDLASAFEKHALMTLQNVRQVNELTQRTHVLPEQSSPVHWTRLSASHFGKRLAQPYRLLSVWGVLEASLAANYHLRFASVQFTTSVERRSSPGEIKRFISYTHLIDSFR